MGTTAADEIIQNPLRASDRQVRLAMLNEEARRNFDRFNIENPEAVHLGMRGWVIIGGEFV